jgi:hypothetical protein
MYSIQINNANSEPIASFLIDSDSGGSIVTNLLYGSEIHGWHPHEIIDDKRGELVFHLPEGSEEKKWCFGTKFPGALSVAVFTHEGYRLTYEFLGD